MRVTDRPFLPPPPKGVQDPAVAAYLRELHHALRAHMLDLYADLSQGQATLTTVSSAPSTDDLDNNQLILRTDTVRLYTKIADALKFVNLT